MIIHDDPSALECIELVTRLVSERGRVKSRAGMHSIGGWHTGPFKLGVGWLGNAAQQRLWLAGRHPKKGTCWGNILPAGAEYGAHVHHGVSAVAVWCLTASGGALYIETPDGIKTAPDRAGQLTIFDGKLRHWVPMVEHERVTVAINLD